MLFHNTLHSQHTLASSRRLCQHFGSRYHRNFLYCDATIRPRFSQIPNYYRLSCRDRFKTDKLSKKACGSSCESRRVGRDLFNSAWRSSTKTFKLQVIGTQCCLHHMVSRAMLGTGYTTRVAGTLIETVGTGSRMAFFWGQRLENQQTTSEQRRRVSLFAIQKSADDRCMQLYLLIRRRRLNRNICDSKMHCFTKWRRRKTFQCMYDEQVSKFWGP